MKRSISGLWSILFERQKTFKISLDYRAAIAFLSVLFGPLGLGASRNTLQLSIVMLSILVTFVFLSLRRQVLAESLRFELVVKVKDILLVTILTILFYFSGASLRSPRLTSDELYYSYNGFNQIAFVLNRVLDKVVAFDGVPYVYFLIASVLIIVGLLKTLRNHLYSLNDNIFISFSYLFVFVFQVAYSLVGINSIHNPPAYSLWYLPASVVLGLTHESFRIATNILFALIGWLVFSSIKSLTRSLLVALLSFGTLMTTPLILQMSGMVEISNFAFIANIVVISRLISNQLIVSPWMIYFSAVMFYFRLTNLVLLACVIVLGIAQNRKVNYLHATTAIMIVMPGVLSIVSARLSFANTQSTDFFPPLMNRVSEFAELLQNSNSYPYLFCFALFLSFIATRFVRGYIFAFIFTLLYLILMLIMTGEQLSNSKYLVEYIYSLTPLFGFIYNRNVARLGLSLRIRNVFVVLTLVAVNTFGLFSQSELIEKTATETVRNPDRTFSYSYLPHGPFPYKEAYNFLKKKEISCLSVGTVYGLVYEIWERYSVSDLKKLRREYSHFLMIQTQQNESPFSVSADTILNSEIECAILGNVTNKESTIEDLRDSDWSVLGKFTHIRFRSTVYILVRDSSGFKRMNS